MKNMKKMALGLLVSFLAWGCNADYDEEFDIANEFPTTVSFTTNSASVDEDATSVTVTVKLIGKALDSDLSITYDLTENGLTEGVDYEFVGTSDLLIAAGEYTGSIVIAPIDNDEIAEGSKSLSFELTGTSNNKISLGSDVAIGRKLTLAVLDDDFWCPRNTLAGLVTTSTDVGYSSAPVTIIPAATEADGCLTFRLVGGMEALLGVAWSFDITLIEDVPGSSTTGTIMDVDKTNIYESNGTTINARKISIAEGVYTGLNNYYDLETGSFGFDYKYYNTSGVNTFDGRLEFCGSSECAPPTRVDIISGPPKKDL
jgi:hypothetical protein